MHTDKGFSIVKDAEIDFHLEFPCFFYDLTDIGNLFSGSTAFFKSGLHIRKCSVQIFLKPSLKDFEYNLTSMWNKNKCIVIWTFFGISLL